MTILDLQITTANSPPAALPRASAPVLLRSLLVRPYSLATLLLIVGVTLLLAFVAWRAAGDEAVAIGTEADRIYLADGFYESETSAENGTYRWTYPFAQITLPNWGPGNVHVAVSGTGVSPGEAILKIDGVPVAHATVQPGQPWTLEGWGTATSANPPVTLEAPAFNPPGDNRTLGLLVKQMSIFAPDARLRAWVNIALLGITGALLYLFLLLHTGRPVVSAIVGIAVPAVYGLLAVYRDPWIWVVGWVAPLALLLMLLLTWRTSRRAPSSASGQGSDDSPPARSRSPVFWGVVSLTAALFLLYLGYMNAFDSDRMYQVTAGLAEYGRPTRYPGFSTWTKYGFGQPLVAVPFYLLGKLGVLLGGTYEPLTRLTVSLTNLLVTALTCWLLYRASRRFAPSSVSFAVAATYLLATPALNYGRTFFSEPAGALLLLAALLLIIPAATGDLPRPRNVLLAGLCLGFLVLFKPAFAVYIPIPGLAVLWLFFTAPRPDQSAPASGARIRNPKSAIAMGALFAVGPVLAGVIQLLYNYVRYAPLANALFRNGYEKEPGFSTPLLEGLGGILLSPGKSIFLYAPVLLLMPVGLWLMYRRGGVPGRLTALVILLESALGIGINAMWWAWTGNFAWGPRLIIPVLPLLIWPLAPLGRFALEALQGRAALLSRTLLALWAVLGALGVLVNIPGAMVDFQVYYRNYGLLLAGDPGEGATIYDPANSPLLVEPRYLLDGLTAAIHRPTLAGVGMPPIYDILVPTALVLLALFALRLAVRPRTQHDPEPLGVPSA